MTITLEIPDEIAAELSGAGRELSRDALEGLAVKGYRDGKLSQFQVGRLLGLSRAQTEDFLAQHVDLYRYDPSELQRELEALAKLDDHPR
jgi:predicted HTH domain antitoxin